MPGKRSTTPLFDLLQQRRPRGVEVRAPEPEVDRPPAAAPAAPNRGLAWRFADAPIRIAGGAIQMPLAYGAVALTVALACIVGSWTLGYRQGERQARSEQAMLESLIGPDSRIVEPGGDATADGSRPSQASAEPHPDRDAPDSTEPARFLTAGGGTNTDPRTPRHNYLYLAAQLEADSARSGIAHLKSRGIEAIAEIDPGTLRRKNGPLYSLIAGRGVPSGEVNSAEARRYRDQVLAAGAAWKQAGGKWDFADAYWRLHTPKGD
ncbi:MAG TPA: hypothetical protein VFF69_05695 [Phycisphaerales bacterium]|nr:hypothetical protein [Phycisphaerales bacterium]